MSAATIPSVSRAALTDAEVAALADASGTPLYVYHLTHLRERVAELRQALAESEATLYFATMANDRLPVLQALAALGVGACTNSVPHLELAVEAGFAYERVQFTSTGIVRDDMRVLRQARVRVNLDSLAQLQAWLDGGAAAGGLRINAASLGAGVRGDRLGIEVSAIPQAIRVARGHGVIEGLHVYVGTNFQGPAEMLPTLQAFFSAAESVETLQYVNLGGGIGVDYQHRGPGFDLGLFGRGIAACARRLRAAMGRHIEVIVEPGRGLAASCGTFVTSVCDVKSIGDQRFVAVDGSVAVFPRPLYHPDTPHRVRPLNRRGDDAAVPTFIVGRTTFSRDILGSTELPLDIRVGDLLAFDDAGAYSQSMASRFLGQPEPHALFLDD